jgi:hypothetical protein
MRVLALATMAGFAITLTCVESAAGPSDCAVVRDGVGDAHGAGPGLAAPPQMDLATLGVKVHGGGLTTTLRVTSTSDSAPTTGEGWSVRFRNGEQAIDLVAVRGPDGVGFSAYGGSDSFNKPWLGEIAGTIRLDTGLISMTAPLELLEIQPGSYFHTVEVDSFQGVATSGQPFDGTPVGPTTASAPQSTTVGADEADAFLKRSLNKLCSSGR